MIPIVKQIQCFVSQILSLNSPSVKGWTPKADGVVEDTPLKEGNEAKVKGLEEEIDQLVYKLYDLTEEKIKIIEVS